MSKHVKRYDVGKLQSAQKTPQGFLRAPAYATRVGVFSYRQPDGTIRKEYRPPEEVFKPDSLATLSGIPLTNKHPAELLSPANTTKYQVGYTGDTVEPEGAFVSTGVTIVDAKTISEIEAGEKRELSCGYVCDLEDTPGIFEGESYDCVQRNIVYNHLAIVGKGRAGPQARLHLDSSDAVMVDNQTLKEGLSMEKVSMGGVDHEMHPEAAKAVKDMMAKHDADMKAMSDKFDAISKEHGDMKAKMEKDAADLKGKQVNSNAEGKETPAQQTAEETAAKEKEFQQVSAKKDELEEQVKTLKEKTSATEIQKLVKERMKLESAARAVGLKKFDELTDMDLKKSVISSKSKIDLKDKTEAYIDARFDSICEGLQGSAVSAVAAALMTPPATKTTSSVHADAEVPNAAEIKQKRMDEDSKAWQQPLSKSRDDVMGKRKAVNNQ